VDEASIATPYQGLRPSTKQGLLAPGCREQANRQPFDRQIYDDHDGNGENALKQDHIAEQIPEPFESEGDPDAGLEKMRMIQSILVLRGQPEIVANGEDQKINQRQKTYQSEAARHRQFDADRQQQEAKKIDHPNHFYYLPRSLIYGVLIATKNPRLIGPSPRPAAATFGDNVQIRSFMPA
jgi:hypothetical protein